MPANKKQGVAVSGHLHIQPVHRVNKAWYSRCFLKPREHLSESNERRDSVHTIRTSCTRETHLVGYTDHACLTFSAYIVSEWLSWHPLWSLSALKFWISPKVLLLHLKNHHQFLLWHSCILRTLQQLSPQSRKACCANQGAKSHTQGSTHQGWTTKAWGQVPASTDTGGAPSMFLLPVFSTILQSSQQSGAEDWNVTREICLYDYCVSSKFPKLHLKHSEERVLGVPAWPSRRHNRTFGPLPKIVQSTALLLKHTFLNAGLWLVPGATLLPTAMLNNVKNWEGLIWRAALK